MDGIERFGETQLDDIDQFYSQLMDEHISEDDYHHAQKVWAHWNMSTMGEYDDLYLRTDHLLLADIFKSFREICLKYYSLDSCHYFTAPGLSGFGPCDGCALQEQKSRFAVVFDGEQRRDTYCRIDPSEYDLRLAASQANSPS